MTQLLFYLILRSFISIKLRNANGYSAFSEPVDLYIFNDDNNTPSDLTTTPVDSSLLPSRPRILVAAYNLLNKEFYLKWLVNSNGGSNIEEVEVKFLKYGGTGPVETNVIGKPLIYFFLLAYFD